MSETPTPSHPRWLELAGAVGLSGWFTLGTAVPAVLGILAEKNLPTGVDQVVSMATLIPFLGAGGLSPLLVAACDWFLRRRLLPGGLRPGVRSALIALSLVLWPLLAAVALTLHIFGDYQTDSRSRLLCYGYAAVALVQLVGTPFFVTLLWRARKPRTPAADEESATGIAPS